MGSRKGVAPGGLAEKECLEGVKEAEVREDARLLGRGFLALCGDGEPLTAGLQETGLLCRPAGECCKEAIRASGKSPPPWSTE